jgi:hypothetical protein
MLSMLVITAASLSMQVNSGILNESPTWRLSKELRHGGFGEVGFGLSRQLMLTKGRAWMSQQDTGERNPHPSGAVKPDAQKPTDSASAPFPRSAPRMGDTLAKDSSNQKGAKDNSTARRGAVTNVSAPTAPASGTTPAAAKSAAPDEPEVKPKADTIWTRWLRRRAAQYRTSFVVSGAVQEALASGSSQTPLTGSLGILHETPKERLRAVIAVANNGDTVLAQEGSNAFASALLPPGITGVGKGAGVTIDYAHYYGGDVCLMPPPRPRTRHPKFLSRRSKADSDAAAKDTRHYVHDTLAYQRDSLQFSDCQEKWDDELARGVILHQRVGWRGVLSVSKSTWTLAGTDPSVHSDSSNLLVTALTTNASWLAINHPEDEKRNSFSFVVEGGLAARALMGDLADKSAEDLRIKTIQTRGKWFVGFDIAPSIQLHEVTAYSMVTLLWDTTGHHVKGLTGVQAVLGFTFDAPLYTY